MRTRLPGDRILMSGHHRNLKYALRSLNIAQENRSGLFYLSGRSGSICENEVYLVISKDGVIAESDGFKKGRAHIRINVSPGVSEHE